MTLTKHVFNVSNTNNNSSNILTTEEVSKLRQVVNFTKGLSNQILTKEQFLKLRNGLLGQSKDKKEFLKMIFKAYDSSLNNFDEECLNNLTSILDCVEIEKIILSLKYKKGLNYKEKVKIIKDLTKDFSMEYFFTLDKIIMQYWEDFVYAEFKLSNLTNLMNTYRYKNDKESKDMLFKQISILMNTMHLIKCVNYDYATSNIISVDDNYKIKKNISYNKVTASLNTLFVIGDLDKINTDDLYEYIKEKEISDPSDAIRHINYKVGTYYNDSILEDLYSKIVLKSEYNNVVSQNRITRNKYLSTVAFDMKDFLKRKVLLPKNGVILLIKDNPVIESIFIKEKLTNYYNNLIIVTKYKDGKEAINTLMIKDWELSMDKKCLYVHIDEYHTDKPSTSDYVCAFFEMYNYDHYEHKPEYEVIAPYYWKYRNNGYTSSNDKVDSKGVVVKREFEIEIAPFIRKINGYASDEAQKLAKKLGIILEDGYTIVKAHNRTYNKINQNKIEE